MFADIKSSYFMEKVFSYINIKKKLKIVKYNEAIKNKIHLNLSYYKIFSSSYIIYNTKKSGKEYNFRNDLVYEGEYLNGERSGKGKEYCNGWNYFEGEYLNGQRNGKGKEYDLGLKFEGEYLNGKRIKGKEYDLGLKFEGEYLNEERNGKGREYDDKGKLIFEGEYFKGKKWNGKRLVYKDDKLISEVEILNGNKWEYKVDKEDNNKIKGKEYNEENKLIYEGEYLNRERHGKGKEYYSNGKLKFEVEYLNGKRWNIIGDDINNNKLINGKGFLKECDKYENDVLFEGEYLNGLRNGKGKEYNEYGILIFEGEYLNGERWKGKEYKENDDYAYNENDEYNEENEEENNEKYNKKNGKVIFEGEYLNGKRWKGKGKDFDSSTFTLEYDGEYLNGERNGKGKEYHWNGSLIYEGEFINNKRNGKGKEYNKDKKIMFDGEFFNGFRLKGKAFIKGKLEFEGDYLLYNKWNGKGYDENGKVIYELINGTGKVKEYFEPLDRLMFEGEYLNGKRNGKGKEYINGKLEFEGEYLNGKRNGKGKEYINGKLVFEGEFI